MNKIVVNFNTCTPAPSGGYNIMFRVKGSGDEYRNAGNFFVSPAIFYDTLNPEGACYEGIITSDCGSAFGVPVNWASCESGESGDNARSLNFSVIEGDPNINVSLNAALDVDLEITSVFVNGYTGMGCTGPIDVHMHSTNVFIWQGGLDYTGAEFSSGPWTGITTHRFYNVVLSWPGHFNIPVSNGSVLVIGSYTVSISITGC